MGLNETLNRLARERQAQENNNVEALSLNKVREYAERIFFEKNAQRNQSRYERGNNQRENRPKYNHSTTAIQQAESMKALLNWRYYVMAVLFFSGALAVARAFSLPDTMTDLEWSKQFLLSLTVGIPCFVLFGILTGKWEREGKIPEYSKQ